MRCLLKHPCGSLAQRLAIAGLVMACISTPLVLGDSGVRFDQPAWSPDARWIAFTDDARDALFAYNTADRTTLKIAESPSGGYAYAWSPDGRKLGFKTLTASRLQVPAYYDLASRRTVALHDAVPQAGVPSFAPDGRMAFTIGSDLQVVDAAGQLLRTVRLPHYANLTPIAPDGRQVAYNDPRDQIRVIDLESGVDREVTSGEVGFFNPTWSPDSSRLIVSTLTGRLMTVEVAGGAVHDLGVGSAASWNSDGTAVLYTAIDRIEGVRLNRADLCLASADGTQLTKLTAGTAQQSTAAHLSPDGGQIAFVSLADGEVYQASVLGTPAASPRASGPEAGLAAGVAAIGSATRISGGAAGLQAARSTPSAAAAATLDQPASAPANSVMISRTVPYLHQLYDTPNDFPGGWACGATSAMMCIAYYEKLPTWDITVSTPSPHISHYGQYVSRVYTFNGVTYNIGSPDPSGDLAYGGYGYIVRNDWADTKGYMRDYFINHAIGSSVDWSPTWAELQAEINAQHPFVLLNMLTTSGHYIVPIGYFTDKRTGIFNDPYGNKNVSYPSTNGVAVYYDWPGYNNGYKNLNTASCFIYARGTVPDTYMVESRAGGQNTAQYSETGTWANDTSKSAAAGVTSGIGARYASTYRSVAGEKHAIFKSNLSQAGSYEVFATWGSGANRRSPVLHRVTHAEGATDVNIDQASTVSSWVSLGTYLFGPGLNAGQVDVSNLNIDVSGSMLADAVKWELRTPIAAPTVTGHPAAASACPGGTVMLTVVGQGGGSLTYQWQKETTAISEGGHYAGVNGPALTISGLDAATAGSYRCLVGNIAGQTPSNAAVVSLKAVTSITQQPSSGSVTVGGATTLTVAGTGDGVLGYQWRKAGAPLNDGSHVTGAATATLTLTNCEGGDAAAYACLVTAGCGSVLSDAATLTVEAVAAPDLDIDGDVDASDLAEFWSCLGASGGPLPAGCENRDFDHDNDVDQADFGILQRCLSGAATTAEPGCEQ